MPARVIVTARQERLGAELRTMREQAGLTVRQAARNLSIDQTKISHMEAGRVGVSEERLRRLAAHYACDDVELVDALVTMATERHKGWWEAYRDVLPAGFLDLAELEHHATFLRAIAVVNVPGLLQTPEYARALFAYASPGASSAAIEARVEHRMRRRHVLTERQTEFVSVVHEAALRIMVADRRTARRQLEHVVELSAAPHVTVRVIPFATEGFAGANYTMLHVGGATPRLDTVQLDGPAGSGHLYAEAQLSRYRSVFGRVLAASWEPEESRAFIAQLAKEL